MEIEGSLVLIVDDDAQILTILEEFFNILGAETFIAFDGLEAWQIFQEREEINLVISDNDMPKLTGVELCRKIRKMESLTPFILLSGRADDFLKAEAASAGANKCLLKPILDRKSVV